MADFKPIETQEQLDQLIGERVARAQRSAEEKYADYEAIKQQNTDLAAQIAQLNQQLQQQAETISGHQTIVDGLNQKVQSYETASVKTKVALEMGLPYQMAERLNGTDEETIRADAKAMKDLIGTQNPVAPLGSGEPKESGEPGSAWRVISETLRNT